MLPLLTHSFPTLLASDLLAFRIAPVHHPLDEIGVLLFGLAVLLGPETDYRQQILDLAEHPALDHFADLLVGCPRRVFPVIGSPGPECELDHFVPEILWRSEEHTSELQSLMRISYAVFCLKKKK